MDNNEETEARAKLNSMSWNDLRKEARINGIKGSMKKAPLIEAILQKMAAKYEDSDDSIEIIGVSMNNSLQSKEPFKSNVSNNTVINTGRTFKYASNSNLEKDNTGDLDADEATVPGVPSEKLRFIEVQEEDESDSLSEEVLQMNATIDGEKDKSDEDAANIEAESVVVNPLIFGSSSRKKEIYINFTEDEPSSLSDEHIQLNTTYDLPQNDEGCENNELGKVVLDSDNILRVVSKFMFDQFLTFFTFCSSLFFKSGGEAMEVDSPAGVENRKSGLALPDNGCDDESVFNFEGAVIGSERTTANDSIMLYTSTRLLNRKTLPTMHTFESTLSIQNPLSKQSLENSNGLIKFDTNAEVEKAIDVQNTTSSQCASIPVKPITPSVQFNLGSASFSRVSRVVSKSIVKRSSMSADRIYSIPNVSPERIDCERMIVGASGASNRLSRVVSAPEGFRNSKFIDLNSAGGAFTIWDKSGASRDGSRISGCYAPYSGHAELENFNCRKRRYQENQDISENLFN